MSVQCKLILRFQICILETSISLPNGVITKAFISGYEDVKIKEVTNNFYEVYGNKKECISYQKFEFSDSALEDWLEFFLIELDVFTQKRVSGPDSHYIDLVGKELSIEVTVSEQNKIFKTVKFGHGLVEWNEKANKVCYVGAPTIFSILKGESLFEDLYTGYNAEWSRNPTDVYNRDIVMMIVMFSYVYKNRLSSSAKERFLINQ